MRSDEELKKTFDLKFEPPDYQHLKIFSATETKEDGIRQAQLIAEAYDELLAAHPNMTFRGLTDLTDISTFTPVPAEVRDIFSKMQSAKFTRKAAVIGHNILLEAAVNLIIQAMGKGQNVRWFTDIDKGKEWLDEAE